MNLEMGHFSRCYPDAQFDPNSRLYHFSKVMAEMVNCPHPQSLSQKGRGARG